MAATASAPAAASGRSASDELARRGAQRAPSENPGEAEERDEGGEPGDVGGGEKLPGEEQPGGDERPSPFAVRSRSHGAHDGEHRQGEREADQVLRVVEHRRARAGEGEERSAGDRGAGRETEAGGAEQEQEGEKVERHRGERMELVGELRREAERPPGGVERESAPLQLAVGERRRLGIEERRVEVGRGVGGAREVAQVVFEDVVLEQRIERQDLRATEAGRDLGVEDEQQAEEQDQDRGEPVLAAPGGGGARVGIGVAGGPDGARPGGARRQVEILR